MLTDVDQITSHTRAQHLIPWVSLISRPEWVEWVIQKHHSMRSDWTWFCLARLHLVGIYIYIYQEFQRASSNPTTSKTSHLFYPQNPNAPTTRRWGTLTMDASAVGSCRAAVIEAKRSCRKAVGIDSSHTPKNPNRPSPPVSAEGSDLLHPFRQGSEVVLLRGPEFSGHPNLTVRKFPTHSRG